MDALKMSEKVHIMDAESWFWHDFCLTLIGGSNGYILVTANGGMNQQRVAVSNACSQIAAYMNFSYVAQSL